MNQLSDHWSAGSVYEQFMGRWSRELAREFVRSLHLPTGLHWLDVGCGTGALTTTICADADPQSVVACDPAASFIEYARAHVDDTRVTFVVADAESFPLRPDGYNSITSLLALNFFPKPERALARMRSAVAADGVISACVWDYSGEMQFLRYFWDAAVHTNPRAVQYDEGMRFTICTPDKLIKLFRDAGLSHVRCEPLEIATVFTSFDDYWQPFLGGTGPAPSFVSSLDRAMRDQLRRRLLNSLPWSSDGKIVMRARAWAIRGHM